MSNKLPNKGALANLVSQKTGLSIEKSKEVIDATFDSVKEIVKKEGSVCLNHFGTFRLITLKPRKQRNPNTGEIMDIPSKKKVRFSSAKGLKDYCTKD